MTAREPDPIGPTRCPRCAKPDAVTAATDHEQDRTGCAWWCDTCRLAFTGTASEFQKMRAEAYVAAAERMASSPTRPETGSDQK